MAFNLNNEDRRVTAMLDELGNQLFDTAGILNLTSSPSNQFAEHTLEDGTVISDHKIILQNRVTVQAILNPSDFESVFQQIKSASNDSTKFTIQTRVDTYDNMYIESYPYEEDAKMIGTIAININFIEQRFIPAPEGTLPPESVINPADTDTVDSGSQQQVEQETTLQSLVG